MQRLRVGEDVALGEVAGVRIAVALARDAVVQQPPARLQQLREPRGVGVDLHLADVLDHPDRGDRVERLGLQLAVVGEPDVDPLRRVPPPRPAVSRARACAGESVMPVTCTPWRAAACSANAPQPQPTSSTRSPGCRPSFVHTSSSFASCASSSVRRARARPHAARVGHRRPEEQLEEVVGDVVVVAHRARVALARVARARAAPARTPAASAAASGPSRRRRRAISRSAVASVDRRRLPRVEQPHDRVDVVDRQLAAHVRAAEARAGRARAAHARRRAASGP